MPFVVRYFSYTSVIFCVDNQWQYTDHVNIIVLVHCLVVAGEKSRRIINSSPLLRWQAHIIQCSTLFVSWQLETFIARSGQPKPERRICKEWMWREYGERKHRMETRQSHHRMVPFWGLSACLQYNCCLTPYELPSTTMWNLHKTVTIMSKRIKNKGVYMVIWFMV